MTIGPGSPFLYSTWKNKTTGITGTVVEVTANIITVQYARFEFDRYAVNDFISSFIHVSNEEFKHPHYYKDVSHLRWLDPYMLGHLFAINDHNTGCLSHALKKIVSGGQRGVKDQATDIQQAIDTLTRYLNILKEIK